MKLKTRKQVIDEMRRKGITVRQWARNKGVSDRTVYGVLRGEKKGNYGEAHKVAVLLGLKEGTVQDAI